MGSEARKLHIFFFPVMAQGHMIPMIDIARIFAGRGVKSTIIATPLNALQFSDTIDRDKQSGLDIVVQIIPFPSVQAGLPEGCESLNSITSQKLIMNYFNAVAMLEQPFEELLKTHRPDCVVADMFLTWTTDVAKRYGIPRIVFHGTSNFSQCVTENIKRYAPHMKVKSDSEIFTVPGLPDQIEMTSSQVPIHLNNEFPEINDRMQEVEVKSYGVLVNSFYELEPAYAEHFKKDMGRRSWNIGPVSLYNKKVVDMAERGKKACMGENYFLSWLNSKEPNSVLYVSFGGICRFGTAQVQEIARGLEASNVSFIWVVRMPRGEEKVQFLPEGFEESMEGKGLIIKDWAPQVLILEHPAVGGFMTHCGWNSIIEGISGGTPLITWPLFAEQFYNEKLVTQVLKIGVSAGNEVWKFWIEPEDVLVSKDKIQEVVSQVMGNGEDAEDRRRRARELGERAKRAIEKDESSYNDLAALIEKLRVDSLQSIHMNE